MMFAEWFIKGGWVMWPLLACSVAGISVTLERAWGVLAYRRAKRQEEGLWRHILKLLEQGKATDALAVARGGRSSLLRIAAAGMEASETMEDAALEVAAQKEIDALRRRLGVLDTVITAAPLLGILGTVTGIISTFDAMAEQASGSPTAVSAGIAEALITTATGLVIALLTLLPYNLFAAYVQRETAHLTEAVHRFRGARLPETLGQG
ncbi:MAG: MotA/TolQ/ExbB proton channel family protein [Kiritimatiellia bacterium]